MNYGIYKNIRGAAWQCLIDCNIVSLPVSVGQIMQHYGIEMIYNSDTGILRPNESGRIIISDVPCVVIRDEHSPQRQRFTAIHELGHYLLGHLGARGELSRSDVKEPQETEADMFAARVLMPVCVLWGIGVESTEDIAKICNVSLTAADIRSRRLELLRSRGKFLSSQLERRVYDNFSEFIQNYNNRKGE